MTPGEYDLPLTENADSVITIVLAGITTATGYSAAIDIRTGPKPTDTLLLGLTSPSGGITLSSDGTDLTVEVTITETQIDTLTPLAGVRGQSHWSLKVTEPGGTSLQYLAGRVLITRTPTA